MVKTVAKGKSNVRTRSQRQVRFKEAIRNSPSSSDEENRGVAPTPPPTNTGKMRRRPLRKILQVLASSDDALSEDGKTTTNGGSIDSDDTENDSESKTDDDPVERMMEIDQLPLMIVKVRKLSEEMAMVCDALERALTNEADEQDEELKSLKKKLTKLTETCYYTVVPAIAKNYSKQADRARLNRNKSAQTQDVESSSKNKLYRSNSVDYTDYTAQEENVTESLPADASAKDSGNPSSVHEESETIREAQDNITEQKFAELISESVETGVANDDPENFYDPILFEESNIEEGTLKTQVSSASDKTGEEQVINDDIFKMHSYAVPKNLQSTSLVARGIYKQDDRESEKLQKPTTSDTSVDIGMKTTDATPNELKSIKIEPALDTLYQAVPSSSKNSNVQLISIKDESSQTKFVTNTDPNPNRKPTNAEIPYIVPHLPKFSVTQTPQGENYELSLMKREIEMRLRVNDLSWVTQRAIRDETSRVKKVSRNNERLEMEMKRFENVLSSNQLILDYDSGKKTFIRVHPELVAKMKPHQKEGIKFMYDCCYGGNAGGRSTGSGCILAHCMGLGKTMQVIALMNTVICYPQLNTKRIIVVCPKSTVMNWAQEIRHWLGDIHSGVSVQVFYLPDNSNIYKKMEVLRGFHNVTNNNAHCLLIGYEAFRSLVFYDAKNKNGEHHSERVRTEVRRILINPGPDLMVLDEGHIIKNRKSQTNLSVSEVATKRRIILTGTPIQNNLNEYFCMVSFVKPAYLGNEREFNENYAKPIRDGQHKDSNIVDIRFMKMKSFILHKHLANFVQRKEFSVLQGFLPEKYEYVLYVPLTSVQEDLYEQYLKRNPFRKDVGGRNLLEDYTFMRKIWTHPIVLERAWENAMKKKYGIKDKRRAARRVRGFDSSSEDEDDNDADNARSITNIWWKQLISTDDLESLFPSNKMLLLFEILRMCQERGEKCLIFSGFVMVLNMVEHFMKMIDEQDKNPKAQLYGFSRFRGPWRPGMDYYRLDGGTSKSIRHEMITKFNDTKNRVTRVFLISTKAGGQGINLVGANRVVILDTSWNPAVDQQGIFRIYRLGQQKSCYIYRLLAIHTMEEKVYSRAVTKQAMSHRVADKKQVDRNYNMAELEELYHFERVSMSARPISAPAVDDVLSTLLLKFPKLIFRYHTHETMLDNKTEQDLTDVEKELAWTEFKKKALTISVDFGIEDDQAGEIIKTDSQLSEIDIDPDLQNLFEYKCFPKCDVPPSNTDDTPITPLPIPAKKKFGKKFNEKLLDIDPEPVENESAIFGEDPYNELSLGGSIIEEQRKKLTIKQEPGVPTPSQVTVGEDEVSLLRALEEECVSEIQSVQTWDNSLEYSTQDVVCEDSIVSNECTDVLVSSEPGLTGPSTSVDVSNDTLSSMIEYDPLSSSQDNSISVSSVYHQDRSTEASVIEPSTYEKFEASLNYDPNVATSTTAPPSVVLVVSTMESPTLLKASFAPPMTRSMKRKMMIACSSAVKSKKAKMSPGNICNELSKSSTACQSNKCRSLIPYVGRKMRCITINTHLKQYLLQNVENRIPTNNCRAIVPYVKRVSLLYSILRPTVDSSLLLDAQVDNDVNDVNKKIHSQVVCQTTTLSWNSEDVNFTDLESFYDESSGMYYTADTDFYAIHDDSNRLALTQCTLPDSQLGSTQQIAAQNENEEFTNDLEELRAALSDEIAPDISEANCSDLVLYKLPVSLWDPQKYLFNKFVPLERCRPISSFWDKREFRMRIYQAERKRQIIRNQRNKCYRFIPYDKAYRTWFQKPPAVDERVAVPTKKCCTALLPYSGNSIMNSIQESKTPFKPKSVVLCSELVEYLTFCRNVTFQSTSKAMSSPKAQRGIKRRYEKMSHSAEKKSKGDTKKVVPKHVRNQ